MSSELRQPTISRGTDSGNSNISPFPYRADQPSASPMTPIRSIPAPRMPSTEVVSPTEIHAPAPPATAGGGAGFAPPPYSESPTSTTGRGLNWGHAASGDTVGYSDRQVARPGQKRRSFLEPRELPSPFAKAPKTRVTNFRSGLKEGGLGAWAEVREGLKGPVGLTWYWAKEGGAIGALNGLGYGTAIFCLCPISASIAFLNHSSRGAIRGVRSAKEQRQLKRSTSKSLPPSSSGTAPTPLSIPRTSTVESTISRRSLSRVGNLLSRVTSTRSASGRSTTGPITPEGESITEGVGVVHEEEAEEDLGHGRITPFPQSPLTPQGGEWEGARSPVKDVGMTRLEMDTKWGSPTSPAFAIASGSGLARSPNLAPTQPAGLNGLHQLELDTKWGSSVLSPLEPPLPHPWREQAEAGPSNQGTPQLERDIKWPILPPSDDPSDHAGGDYGEVSLERGRDGEVEERPPLLEETSGLEMQLKWENEMARAAVG